MVAGDLGVAFAPVDPSWQASKMGCAVGSRSLGDVSWAGLKVCPLLFFEGWHPDEVIALFLNRVAGI